MAATGKMAAGLVAAGPVTSQQVQQAQRAQHLKSPPAGFASCGCRVFTAFWAASCSGLQLGLPAAQPLPSGISSRGPSSFHRMLPLRRAEKGRASGEFAGWGAAQGLSMSGGPFAAGVKPSQGSKLSNGLAVPEQVRQACCASAGHR